MEEMLTPQVIAGHAEVQPLRPRNMALFTAPTLLHVPRSAQAVLNSVMAALVQQLPTSLSYRLRKEVRMAIIADGMPEVDSTTIEEDWQRLCVNVLRTAPRGEGEWIPRDQLGSNRALVHAWVHLRGLDDRFMYNPRTQEWRQIEIARSQYPVHRCIANLDTGSATTIISMHTAKALKCPIHQNVDVLPLKGVQGANFEANYHCTVAVAFIGTYWDSEQDCYRNGAYEMIVQALILPTLSVPILVGNQALQDHYYDNVPGSLDFSMGHAVPVACKAVAYDTVRSHCIAGLGKRNGVVSHSVVRKEGIDCFRGGRTRDDLTEDTGMLLLEEPAVASDKAPAWVMADGGVVKELLEACTTTTGECLIPPFQSMSLAVRGDHAHREVAVRVMALRTDRTQPSLYEQGLVLVEDCVTSGDKPCVLVTNRSEWPVRVESGDIQVEVSGVDEAVMIHGVTVRCTTDRFTSAVTNIGSLREDDMLITASATVDCERPPQFPLKLWQYVAPEFRLQAAHLYGSYSSERLAEILAEMERLDVYEKDSEHGQRTLAQAYYNLDAYFHPMADHPPVVEGTEFRIETSSEVPRVQRHKRLSAIQKASVEARVRKMMRQGKLQPSKSPISLGMVLVEYPERIRRFIEKHGVNADAAMMDPIHEDEVASFYRLTVDLRPVNEVTIPDMFPLPRLLDLLDSAQGSGVFSITDLEDAFFTIALAPEDRYKTAFSTHNGHYEFCVMPQGARNAANVWARHVSKTFEGIPSTEVMVYQDDISPHAPHYEALFDRMQKVYDRVKMKKNVLKLGKTHLDYPEITFLGHVLNAKGRRPCPKKTAAIRELAMPTSVKEVQCFLGMLTFYRDYIPSFATLATPLYGLLKKDIVFEEVWSDEHVEAVNRTKKLLTSYGPQEDGSCPVLRLPDFNAPYRLHIDAAKIGTGLGAVLLQQDIHELQQYRQSHPELAETPDAFLDKAWHPVAYWSKTITGAQKRYSATELETMALHHAILHFHAYLQNGREFEVITDHKALVFMINRNFNIKNTRLARYALDLQGYYFRVTHREGVKNLDADAVSRLLRQVQSHGDYLTKEDLMDSSGVMEYTEEERILMEEEAKHCNMVGWAELRDTVLEEQFVLDTAGRHLMEPTMCHMMTRGKAAAKSAVEQPQRTYVRGRKRNNQTSKQSHKRRRSVNKASTGHLEARLRNPKKWRAKYSEAEVRWNGVKYEVPAVKLERQETRRDDEVEEQWDAEVANEEILAGYQHLVQKRFRGTDGVIYEVTRLTVDAESQMALAYTKEVDNNMELESAIPLFGENGAVELVEKHWVPQEAACMWPETEEDMFELQRQDEHLSAIIENLFALGIGVLDDKGYYLPQHGSREGVRQHGALMRQHDEGRRATMVVPQILRETVLRLYHDGWAHPGTKRMYESLKIMARYAQGYPPVGAGMSCMSPPQSQGRSCSTASTDL